MSMTYNYHIGSGYDTHCTTPDRPLALCGIQILSPLGLLGHSDAGAVLHALMDVLLGVIGQRGVGYHFPDANERYHETDNTKFLATIMQMVCEGGCQMASADLTIIAQQPKPSSHILQTIVHLKELLDAPRANVKATTHEHLGPLGNNGDIAAQAVVLFTCWSFSGK